jgi:hypothetical protein
MVDFISPNSTDFNNQVGVFVQVHDANRWRAMLDLRRAPLAWLTGHGAQLIADSPVTLEELFVALGRN